jgi:hypothetical protein
VVIPPESVVLVNDLVRRADALVAFMGVDEKKQTIAALEQKISETNFWDDRDHAREIMQQISALRGAIEPVVALRDKIFDLNSFMALLLEEEDESLLADFERNCLVFVW